MLKFCDIKLEPLKFDIKENEISFSGILFKKDGENFLKGLIKGEIARICDSCGENETQELNLDVDLLLSDGIYSKNDRLDVYEFFGGEIDLKEILNSEIQSLKSDYFYCKNCKFK